MKLDDFIFKSRLHDSPHITTRTYARIVEGWVESIGLDPSDYGTHSLRRTKASLLYKMRHNLREIQILLGHKKIESTVHYLGDDDYRGLQNYLLQHPESGDVVRGS